MPLSVYNDTVCNKDSQSRFRISQIYCNEILGMSTNPKEWDFFRHLILTIYTDIVRVAHSTQPLSDDESPSKDYETQIQYSSTVAFLEFMISNALDCLCRTLQQQCPSRKLQQEDLQLYRVLQKLSGELGGKFKGVFSLPETPDNFVLNEDAKQVALAVIKSLLIQEKAGICVPLLPEIILWIIYRWVVELAPEREKNKQRTLHNISLEDPALININSFPLEVYAKSELDEFEVYAKSDPEDLHYCIRCFQPLGAYSFLQAQLRKFFNLPILKWIPFEILWLVKKEGISIRGWESPIEGWKGHRDGIFLIQSEADWLGWLDQVTKRWYCDVREEGEGEKRTWFAMLRVEEVEVEEEQEEDEEENV